MIDEILVLVLAKMKMFIMVVPMMAAVIRNWTKMVLEMTGEIQPSSFSTV